jgi:FkbM family methyltransferase
MNIENLKQEVLEKIDKKIRILKFLGISIYEKLIGPGYKKRILRFFLTPQAWMYLKSKKALDKIYSKIYNKNKFNSNKELLFDFINNCDSLNELKTIKFFVKNLKENDIFYDIGAEVGLYASLALEFCKEVHSFEPMPKSFKILNERFGNYKNVYLNNFALSDQEGFTEFCEGPTTIVEDLRQKYKKQNSLIKVEIKTLDFYINSHRVPTYIKMDIEGAEYLVIKGGKKFFRENSPIIAIEVLGDEFLDISLRAVNLLLDFGYKIFKINFDGELESCSNEEIKKSKGVCNYVFKK